MQAHLRALKPLFALHHRVIHVPRVERVGRAIATMVGRASSILDVGAGDGMVARTIAAEVGASQVIGVDVKVRPEAFVPVMPYDGEHLPFPDGAFEAVVLSDVLHHCARPNVVLREALRVSGRVVAIKDHFCFGTMSRAILLAMDVVGNAAPAVHVAGTYFSAGEWAALVHGAGARFTGLLWPLQIHDYPFRLVTQDRLQFAARIEPIESVTMRSFVIGGAGFIGSHMVDGLVSRGPVTIFDNLSVGSRAHVAAHLASGAATLIEADALDLDRLTTAVAGHDLVVHLAANPEARWGLLQTRLDLEQGTIATYNVLEAMRRAGVPRLIFSSSGTVYGETPRVCAEGDLGELPISLYGASKLAGEALVSAFVECFGLTARIFRFGNVVGPRGTHGAALDFLKKLKEHRTFLSVLGDGRQEKPYLFVTDCVDGMLFGLDHATERLAVFNLAPPDGTRVATIAELCVAASPYKNAEIRYTGGDRGWPGDVPRSRMDPDKLAALGFRVKFSSDEAVARAVTALAEEVFGDEGASEQS